MLCQLSYVRAEPQDTAIGGSPDPAAAPTMRAGRRASQPLEPTFKGVAVRSRIRQQSGQTMAEYGVILALITASILAGLIFFSGKVLQAIEHINSLL